MSSYQYLSMQWSNTTALLATLTTLTFRAQNIVTRPRLSKLMSLSSPASREKRDTRRIGVALRVLNADDFV
jgi:hypothetical protein